MERVRGGRKYAGKQMQMDSAKVAKVQAVPQKR